MPINSVQQQLLQAFPKANKEKWLLAASKEVTAEDSQKVLSWRTEDSQTFFTYYDRGDSEKNVYLKQFSFPPSDNPYTGAREWVSLPIIVVNQEHEANKQALHSLSTGADGVLFDLRNTQGADLNSLLEKINWPYCEISFLINFHDAVLDELPNYAAKNNFQPALLTGSIYSDTLSNNSPALTDTFSSFLKYHRLGFCVAPSTPVTEIVDALTKATTLTDTLTEQGFDKHLVWRNLSVSLTVGEQFFLEIAKLKALRLLWYQLACAFGVKNYQPEHLRIHTLSSPWVNDAFEPHGNMLKSTSAALSSIIGGCNSLSIAPADTSPMSQRISTNVSNILREESHLDKVADPLAGAYALDEMVTQLAEAAWERFKQNIQAI